ncbi:PH domain-containing protein [Archaeoglobus profundus]|uniref:Bacterial Pleckstrin homology domain-containing protein n=1 Tax=Archaeoglobus profundus (strain DSM 5631 / JCM 9629 / NBRC 100127 / Av18) TaxID=572546 RepID=D2RH36_ARCPA|nr:PH domain-containing protein [Archaeoglobus profundus]ADB57611.1 hypothetical protein Arcpr_0545 [Archaeoglobus profundus DSM 5631]
MANEVFQVIPPRSFVVFSTALILGLIALTAYVWLITVDNVRYITLSITLIILAICAYFFIVAPYQTSIVLNDQIEVIAPPYAHESISKDVVLKSYVADIGRDENLRPVLRVGGTSFGSYKVGWFKLKNGKTALIVATQSRVVCFELKDKIVMISPNDFERFVNAPKVRSYLD